MLEVIKLFVRRMLMGKGKGILKIPPQKNVDDFANDLFKKFKQNGVSDEAVTNPNDVKAIWNQITNREAQIFNNNLKDALQKPDPFKKAGEVFDLKGKKIKNTDNIMGGEELPGEINIFSNKYLNDLDKKIIDSDAFGYSQKEWNNLSNSSKEKFRKQFDSNYADAMENTQMATLKEVETDAEILARLKKVNKESLSNMRYEAHIKVEEAKAAADEDYIMKIFDPEDFAQGGRAGFTAGGGADRMPTDYEKFLMQKKLREMHDFQNYMKNKDIEKRKHKFFEMNSKTGPGPTLEAAEGGRAGLYRGGQAMIEPNLSDIGHGSDALMARNALLTPGSQATTSTGLNYLLGEDNDTTRVPYKHGDMVLPKEKPINEYMLKQLMSQAGAETLDARTRDMFIQMYKKKIREKNSKADGGPARQNFGMGKRAFLKWMASGAATIGAAKSGLFGFGKKSAVKSVIAPATQAANEAAAPPYFLKLLTKIKKLGDDVTETGALAERQKVKQYKDYTLTEDTTTGRIEIQKIKNEAGEEFGKDNFGNGLTEEVYMGYTPPETIIVKGKSVKTKPEYDEGTAYLRNDGPNTGDVYEEVSGVTDEVLKEVGEAIVKKADGGRIGYKLGKKVVETIIKKAGEGKFTKNEVLLNMFQNTIKQSKSPDTKKRFINFIEEIKLKPELSKDPNVWNFFTKGLPKNQKLVVYGDDTVDFWTQSEFGPHNIAKSAKFQKKHPYLTKDQAVKIQNMEPEDQIFEMKRLEAIRKRTANATGGRVPMLFGGGIFKTIIKNLAKSRGINPSEYLKITNYKTLPREVRNLMSEADFKKMKTGRIEMFENLVEMSKTKKDFQESIVEGKKSPAAPLFEHLEQSFKSPVPSSVTNKDILQGEFILKNLKTKDRKLHASGGRIGFSTGKGIMAIIKNLLKPKAKLSYAEKYPRIDIKELMKGDKKIKLYSGVGDRQANTLKAYKEAAKDFGVTPEIVAKDNYKGQWFTPFKEYASGFGNKRNIASKMLTTELTPKEIKMALRYVEKINKTNYLAHPHLPTKKPRYPVTTDENTVLIPKIKLKKLKKAGKIDTDYMVLDKIKSKLGLSKGGIAAMLGE